jgi:hypothetical protein
VTDTSEKEVTMVKRLAPLVAALLSVVALAGNPAQAEARRVYRVTIVNLTSGQPLTPPVVAIHRNGFHVFEVGQPASFGVKEVAENGNNAPLLEALTASPMVGTAVQAGNAPLVPEGTPGAAMFDDQVTFRISAPGWAGLLSFVSMLVCTNDGFTGVDGLPLPLAVGQRTVAMTAGYDAGTEINTEDFADIVPPCQDLIGVSTGEPGATTSNPALAEGGVIHHHEGIQGIADLVPEIHGWTDPVATIRVQRIR